MIGKSGVIKQTNKYRVDITREQRTKRDDEAPIYVTHANCEMFGSRKVLLDVFIYAFMAS